MHSTTMISRIINTILIINSIVLCSGCLSKSRPSPEPTTQKPISTTKEPSPQGECSYPTEKLVCVDDYNEAANKIFNANAKAYFSVGADDELTFRDNVLAYKRLTVLPRFLVDVSHRQISTTILGKPVSLPIGVSPSGFHKVACPEGEIATARAAADAGSIFILSTFSNTKIEDVAKGSPTGRKWMQVYLFKRRAATVNLIKRAEASGFEAVVATVDSPVNGFKREHHRLPFRLPSNLSLANFGEEMGDLLGVSGRNTTDEDLVKNFDSSLTWKDIIWLKKTTKLPIFLKGILNADDAEKGMQSGAHGIFVSNHGGRQLDTVTSTVIDIDILPEIVERVRLYNGSVLIDSGVRLGTDIFKALAYGANMVFAGRPFIWGLAVSGEEGVKNIFTIFRDEFNTTMALAGVPTVDKITSDYVGRSMSPQPHFVER